MKLKNKNPWKYLSVGLLGVIAIGLLTPVDAKPPSGQQDDNQFEIIFSTIDDLQSQLDIAVGDFQGQIDALVLALDGETLARIADVDAEEAARISDVDVEETRALAAEAAIAGDLADHETADGDLSDTNELQSISGTGSVDLSNSGGSVSCADITGDASLCDSDDANTIYTAGTGLILGGTAFSADTATLQKRVTGTCPAGQSIRVIDGNGAVTCEIDTDTNTTYDGSDFWVSSQQTCAAGKVVTEIKADGTVTCATDAGGATHKTYILKWPVTTPGNSFFSADIACNSNDIALSGGYSMGQTGLFGDQMQVLENNPGSSTSTSDGGKWHVKVWNAVSTSQPWSIWIKCLDLDGDFGNQNYPTPGGKVIVWES